jgi:hypothetical protein
MVKPPMWESPVVGIAYGSIDGGCTAGGWKPSGKKKTTGHSRLVVGNPQGGFGRIRHRIPSDGEEAG